MNWQLLLRSIYGSGVRILRKDWVYVLLLCINLVVLFGAASQKQSEDIEPTSYTENSVQEDRRTQLLHMLEQGENSEKFVVLVGVMLAAVAAGIVLFITFLIRGFPFRKNKTTFDEFGNQTTPVSARELLNQSLCNIAWNFWDVCKVLIVFFTAYFAFSILQEIVLRVLAVPKDAINYDFLMILDMLFAEIIAIFFLLRFVQVHYGVDLRVFGLHYRRLYVYVLFGLASYLMFLPLFFLINAITFVVGKLLSIELQPQEIFYMFTEDSRFSTYQMRITILFIMVLGPLFEEIFFRGFLYRILRKYCGYVPALLISALFFAYIHHNFMAFLPIFALGIILGILVEKTGSLVPSVVMHVLVNSVSLALLLTLIGD